MSRSRDPFEEAAQADLARLRADLPKDEPTQTKADAIVAKAMEAEQKEITDYREQRGERVEAEKAQLAEERSRPQPRPTPPPGIVVENPLHPAVLERDASRNVEHNHLNEIQRIREDRDQALKNLSPPERGIDDSHGPERPSGDRGRRDDGAAPATAERSPRQPDDRSGDATRSPQISDEMRQRIAEKAAQYDREMAEERTRNQERGPDPGRTR